MGRFQGTLALARLILRRDRIGLAVWVFVIGMLPISIARSFEALYPDAASIQAFVAASANTPATIGLLGPIYSATLGGLVAWRTGIQTAFLIGPISLLLLIRHTRTDEDAGRRELLGSSVVGRLAPLAAALLVIFGANVLIALLFTLALSAYGLPVAGSLMLGLSAAAFGWIAAAVGAVAAQMAEQAGPARSIGLVALGALLVPRVVGDTAGSDSGLAWLSWLSPLGWIRFTRAYAGEQWWVLVLPLLLAAALVLLAFALAAQRDLGAGLIPVRPGPAQAAAYLRNPLALGWRLHRGGLYGWLGAMASFGLLLGMVGQNLSAFLNTPALQQWAEQMGARNSGDAFLFLIIYVMGQIASTYGIALALAIRGEETNGRAEPVLAAPIGRLRWAGGHLWFAFAGPALVLAVLGIAISLGYGLAGGSVLESLNTLFIRAVAVLPAAWVMVGATAALVGLLPRAAAAVSWGALALFLLLELARELQQVSQNVFGISPFAHVYWAEPITLANVVGLVVVAALLLALGLFGMRRRDIG